MGKEDVVHTYNGILLSHKKEIMPLVATWAKAFDCMDHNKLKEMGLPIPAS